VPIQAAFFLGCYPGCLPPLPDFGPLGRPVYKKCGKETCIPHTMPLQESRESDLAHPADVLTYYPWSRPSRAGAFKKNRSVLPFFILFLP